MALEFASEKLKKDKHIVIMAVMGNAEALKFAD